MTPSCLSDVLPPAACTSSGSAPTRAEKDFSADISDIISTFKISADGRGFVRLQMQAMFSTPLQYIFRRLRPFSLAQVGDFPLIEQGTKMAAEIGRRSCPVEEIEGHAAIKPCIVPRQSGVDPGVTLFEPGDKIRKAFGALEIATGQM